MLWHQVKFSCHLQSPPFSSFLHKHYFWRLIIAQVTSGMKQAVQLMNTNLKWFVFHYYNYDIPKSMLLDQDFRSQYRVEQFSFKFRWINVSSWWDMTWYCQQETLTGDLVPLVSMWHQIWDKLIIVNSHITLSHYSSFTKEVIMATMSTTI